MSPVAFCHRYHRRRVDEYQWNAADFVLMGICHFGKWFDGHQLDSSQKFLDLLNSTSRAFRMRFAMSSAVSRIHDAAASPEAWPQALAALTDAMGVAGAALIISNKSTGNVDEACFSGLSAGFKSDYVRHYAAVDPYSPLLDGSWKKLSECLPEQLLRESEWYNDFVLGCGVRDILGARLVNTPSHRVIFGIHQQIGRAFSDKVDSLVDLVAIPLEQAAQRHLERFSSGIHVFEKPGT